MCDPETIGLPDPASLTPARRKRDRPPVSQLGPADSELLEALRAWRIRAANGSPAYTVAHNRTLEAIAVLRPSSLDELEQVKGVGPTFLERHGADVLALISA